MVQFRLPVEWNVKTNNGIHRRIIDESHHWERMSKSLVN